MIDFMIEIGALLLYISAILLLIFGIKKLLIRSNIIKENEASIKRDKKWIKIISTFFFISIILAILLIAFIFIIVFLFGM